MARGLDGAGTRLPAAEGRTADSRKADFRGRHPSPPKIMPAGNIPVSCLPLSSKLSPCPRVTMPTRPLDRFH